MMRLSFVWVLLASLTIVGCAATQPAGLVTPLPTQDQNAAQSTPEPTLTRLEATVTQLAVTPTAPDATATRPPVTHNQLSSFAFVTSTPSQNNLAPGEARAIALATDAVLTPTFQEGSEKLTFDSFPVPLTFSEFYTGFSIRHGLLYTDKLKSLDGQQVVIEGYVAPPLKPKLDFFVLTRIQLAFCPFCSSDVEWPDDIVLVYLPQQQVLSTENPIRLTGQLELGSSVDAETGMVSLVRIYAENIETLH